MLGVAREGLERDLTWSKQKCDGIRQAEMRLQSAFERVAAGQ